MRKIFIQQTCERYCNQTCERYLFNRHAKDIYSTDMRKIFIQQTCERNRQSLVSVLRNIILQSVLGFIQEICEDVSTILIIKHLQQSLVSLWSVFGKYLAQQHHRLSKILKL